MGRKAEFLDAFYKDIWENKNLDNLDQYLCRDTTANHVIPDMCLEFSDHYDMFAMILGLFEKLKVDVVHSIEQEDWVAAVVKMEGISAVANENVLFFCQIMARFKEEKFHEVYVQTDFATLFEQLGQLPENCHGMLLSGSVLK